MKSLGCNAASKKKVGGGGYYEKVSAILNTRRKSDPFPGIIHLFYKNVINYRDNDIKSYRFIAFTEHFSVRIFREQLTQTFV